MNERMGRFAAAYLMCGDAKQAALEAGYSESYARSHAYKLVEHPQVKDAIESCVIPDEWAPCEVTNARAKEVLSTIVLATPDMFVGPGGYIDIEEGGIFRHAIRELTIKEDTMSRPRATIKFWDKIRAIRELKKWNDEEAELVSAELGKRVNHEEHEEHEGFESVATDISTDNLTDSEVGSELKASDSTDGIVGRSDMVGACPVGTVRRQEAPPTGDDGLAKLPRKERRRIELARRREAKKDARRKHRKNQQR